MRFGMLLVACVMLLSGCASVFKGTSQNITFTSEPSGAEVKINGVTRGTTPLTVRLRKDADHFAEMTMPGYRSQILQVNREFDAVTLINILFWPGFIVDAATGALEEADPTTYHGKLTK